MAHDSKLDRKIAAVEKLNAMKVRFSPEMNVFDLERLVNEVEESKKIKKLGTTPGRKPKQKKQLGGPIYNDPAKPLQGGAGMMKYRGGGALPYTQRWASARARGG